FLDFFHDVFDTSWMDATISQQTLQRQPCDLSANRVKARDNDCFWGIVNDEVDTCSRFEGTNITPFPANDAALHLLARQRHDRDRAFHHVVSSKALNGQTRIKA